MKKINKNLFEQSSFSLIALWFTSITIHIAACFFLCTMQPSFPSYKKPKNSVIKATLLPSIVQPLKAPLKNEQKIQQPLTKAEPIQRQQPKPPISTTSKQVPTSSSISKHTSTVLHKKEGLKENAFSTDEDIKQYALNNLLVKKKLLSDAQPLTLETPIGKTTDADLSPQNYFHRREGDPHGKLDMEDLENIGFRNRFVKLFEEGNYFNILKTTRFTAEIVVSCEFDRQGKVIYTHSSAAKEDQELARKLENIVKKISFPLIPKRLSIDSQKIDLFFYSFPDRWRMMWRL